MKKVFITGANKSIGFETARQLLQRGYYVYLGSRTLENGLPEELGDYFMIAFYKIAYKVTVCGKAKYGQNYYDFGEGGLIFTAPNQLFETPKSTSASGYMLLIHPDFFLTYPLAKKIR